MIHLTGAKEAVLGASVGVGTRTEHGFCDCKLMATFLGWSLSDWP